MGVALPPTGAAFGMRGVSNNLVFEPLVSIGWDGRPVGKLASAWEWSPDRLTVTLKLDPKIRFHDDSPLTPSIAAAILSKQLTPRAQPFAITFASVRAVHGLETGAVTVRLSRPEAFFFEDLANATLSHPDQPLVGTGPFKYADLSATRDSQERLIRLEAFEAYHRGSPAVQSVELRRYDDQRAAWAALMRDDIDAVHEVSPGAMDFVENQSTIRTFPHTRPYFIQLLFNLRHPVLKSQAVRQALSHAVDREHMVKVALHGRGIVADSPIWPQHWAYGVPPKTYSRNTEAATLLLDGAGHRLKAPPEPGRMRSRFRFVCLTLANDARYEKLGILLQKQLYEIGVDMDVVALPWQELRARIGKGDFDALLMERTSGRSLTWAYLTFHSTQSASGYTAADAVLNRLRSAPSESETRAAMNEFLQILYDNPPAIFLAWPIVSRAVSDKFVVPAETGRDVLGSLWQWRPAAPRAP
jgi:peptide/nickel transport system substrate-binding protein